MSETGARRVRNGAAAAAVGALLAASLDPDDRALPAMMTELVTLCDALPAGAVEPLLRERIGHLAEAWAELMAIAPRARGERDFSTYFQTAAILRNEALRALWPVYRGCMAGWGGAGPVPLAEVG